MKRRHSIITDDLTVDFFDGSRATEIHHIFGGPNRKHSEEDGLIVGLNHWNHNEPPLGVHFNVERRTWLQQVAEAEWIIHEMKSDGITFEDGIERFRQRYKRSAI